MKERDIQKQILHWLKYQKNVYPIRINPVGIPLHNKQGSFRPSGMKGVSDIVCCVEGYFVAFEVKRPRGKLTREQVEFLNVIRSCGGFAYKVTSLDEVILIIKKIKERSYVLPQ